MHAWIIIIMYVFDKSHIGLCVPLLTLIHWARVCTSPLHADSSLLFKSHDLPKIVL